MPSTLNQAMEAALLLVMIIGLLMLFSLTNTDNTTQTVDNLGRFIYAVMNTLAPTNPFEIVMEFVVATLGFVSLNRVNTRVGVLGAFFLYFLTSFLLAWITAPV
ncbi:hypothetical protein [Salinirubrum litoreum]|uniref:Uncharacterized protein n=1 Tax=Salinirubrum litoreum TaxID=1126234 RepID=A0ABD5R6E4_9EURY|nr:hypothetical protein [Salinirubrum litoreum]